MFFTAGVWCQDLFLPKALIVWDVVISAWFCHCWYMHTQCHSRGQKWCQMMAHMVLHLVIVYCVGCVFAANLPNEWIRIAHMLRDEVLHSRD
jgi:hypothetical protein